MNELGYDVGKADGDFGGKTEKAIKRFQSDNRLTVTGMVDYDTYSALFPVSADSETVAEYTSNTQEEMKNDDEQQVETSNPKVVDVLAYSVGPAILLDNNEIYSIKYNEDTFMFPDVVSATDYGDNIIATRSDGSTFVYRGYGTFLERNSYELDDEWTDMALVADGLDHAVGLKKNGTWISTGEYRNNECDVDSWKDIIALDVGYEHTVGLKSDGTVVATGSNRYKQCDVSQWSDIIAIAVAENVTIGLKSDGTVVATGDDSHDQCFVGRWKNIIAIQNDDKATVGLTKEGKIVSTNKEVETTYNLLMPEDYLVDEVAKFYCNANYYFHDGNSGRHESYIMFVKKDGTVDLFGTPYFICVADRLKHHIENGFDPAYETSIRFDSTTYSDSKQMKVILDAFKELGSADINGDGHLSIDEIFQN